MRDFLRRNQYSAAYRGEQLYCVAKKRGGRAVVRYPKFLYEGA